MTDDVPAVAGPARRRSPWPFVGGVVVVLLLALVAVFAVAGSDGERQPTAGADLATGLAGVTETKALLDGVPQRGFTIGDPNAPVTLLEYVDLQCPYCKAHQLEEQPTLIRELVRTGQARLTLIPLAFLGSDSVRGRNVLMRLARGNHAWEFANLFYWNQGTENSGYATQAFLDRLVAAIPGTEPADASAEADAQDAPVAQAADALGQAVLTKHESGTPSFTVGPTGGPPATYRWITTYQDRSLADQIVRAVRKERKRVLADEKPPTTA